MSALQPNICKAFTVDVYQRLKQAGVMTVVDFVTRDKEELSQSCGIAFKVTVTELGLGESRDWRVHPRPRDTLAQSQNLRIIPLRHHN